MNETKFMIHGGRPGPFEGMLYQLQVRCLDSVNMGDRFRLPVFDGNPLPQIAKRRAVRLRGLNGSPSKNDYFAGICLAVVLGETTYDVVGDLAAATALFSAVSGKAPTLQGALYVLPPAGCGEMPDDRLCVEFELPMVMPLIFPEFAGPLEERWSRKGLGTEADLATLLLEKNIGSMAVYREAIEQGTSDLRSVLTNVGYLE